MLYEVITELGRLVTREMGKVLPEGLGDVQEAVDMAYFMAGEGRRLPGETAPSELLDKDCKTIRVPHGVFALITPWNFPVAIPVWKIFAALICGNTAVFRITSYNVCYTKLLRTSANLTSSITCWMPPTLRRLVIPIPERPVPS